MNRIFGWLRRHRCAPLPVLAADRADAALDAIVKELDQLYVDLERLREMAAGLRRSA
jgi:hypothetical protein